MYLLIFVTIISVACTGLFYYRYIAGKGDEFLLQVGEFVSVMAMTFFGTALITGNIHSFLVYRILVSVGAAIVSAIAMRKSRIMATGENDADKN